MKSLAEIGDMLGVTRERVRQIEAKALKKLRPPGYGSEVWMNMSINDKLEVFIAHHDEKRKREMK